MTNYYRYFPVSEEDESWGLTVLNAGCTDIEKSTVYPPITHPSHHYFNWDKGRILHEYQLIYITNGKGVFESEHCKKEIREGSLILLFPDEIHRYKPDFETGWNEYWVGFEGSFAINAVSKNFFSKAQPIIHIGYNEKIMNLFVDIIQTSKEEKSGYQPVISGAIIYLLGLMYSAKKQDDLKDSDTIQICIDKARVIMRSKIYEKISFEKLAEELEVSYSWFRKVFKKHIGLAPGQYMIQLKIQKAKELLGEKSVSVKEVAYKLQFESSLYFSKLFKDKVGISPVSYKNQVCGQDKYFKKNR
jgi:AraC-like DNA-binding protein